MNALANTRESKGQNIADDTVSSKSTAPTPTKQSPPEVHNFGSGPGKLPTAVLDRIRDELTDWNGSGSSLLETPFTHPSFKELAAKVEQDLRSLMAIPEGYHVLFTQGGATTQFASIPMNLLGKGERADYVHTGYWSAKAFREAKCQGALRLVEAMTREPRGIRPTAAWELDPDAAYCHIVSNETADGVEFPAVPDCGPVPIVADMSSNILSRREDVQRYGLIYASAQKNLGVAGLTVIIVRDDLLGQADPRTPSPLDYRKLVENRSMFNTPPTFALYVLGLVLDWVQEIGGIAAIEKSNRLKSDLLYEAIAASPFYRCPVQVEHRSRVNICFNLPDPKLEAEFVAAAELQGLRHLRGHPAWGGVRASVYNAMEIESVKALIQFMRGFEKQHG